jgi:hypothetical protein
VAENVHVGGTTVVEIVTGTDVGVTAAVDSSVSSVAAALAVTEPAFA